MGAVSVDIYKKEREYENVTLSDENVVKYLILYRSKVDVSFGANTNINIEQAGDMFEFNQELIALYSSLDKTVEQCEFKEKQTKLLELIYEGYTLQDICSMNIGYKRSATYDLFDRMVLKIVKINNENWKRTMTKMGYIK
ncbi:hypothetical protein PQE75_gp103 [Bacillus phage vB_BcoS-136]|uniref:Uncharacterized protein n=1 Tax=Bacillus phage vB_BcoS-136 TaxID=2419619 RepID=A0A3G3BVF3_9CAUD|nr:hypothetical protein PQE75_gp103 [Bacillus phage vB_BcoS-136]AYP68235.1 hypothetical protein vBBcoS136_00103 [Bacillus phage vB_BcoS-136]